MFTLPLPQQNSQLLGEVATATLTRCRHAAMAFQQPVSPAHVSDYYRFVPPEREMHLVKVLGKLQCNLYRSAAEFRADFEQLYVNVLAYHSPRCGQQAVGAIIPIAKELLEVCYEELVRQRDRLWAAEDLIKVRLGARTDACFLPSWPCSCLNNIHAHTCQHSF